jgi:spermidine synthase
MNDLNLYPESVSSLWIQNLINGLSGQIIKVKQALYCESSPFQKVEVFETYSYGNVLCLGGSIVMTENDDTYHEMMVHPAVLMHNKPRTVCCIGGGDGGCLKELLKYPEIEKIVIIEIDQLVPATIRNHFPALAEGFDDPRVEMVINDGYNYLKTNDQIFDIILVDSFDPGGPVQSLETSDFHEIVAQRISREGIAVFQTDSPLIRSSYIRSTIQSISPFYAVYSPYICYIRAFPDGICSFLVCTHDKEILEQFDHERYTTIASRCNYYNDVIHQGSFMLPQYLKRIVNS